MLGLLAYAGVGFGSLTGKPDRRARRAARRRAATKRARCASLAAPGVDDAGVSRKGTSARHPTGFARPCSTGCSASIAGTALPGSVRRQRCAGAGGAVARRRATVFVEKSRQCRRGSCGRPARWGGEPGAAAADPCRRRERLPGAASRDCSSWCSWIRLLLGRCSARVAARLQAGRLAGTPARLIYARTSGSRGPAAAARGLAIVAPQDGGRCRCMICIEYR